MSLAHDTETIAGPGHNTGSFRDPLDVEIDVALRDFQDQLDRRGPEVERVQIGSDDEAGRAAALIKILADLSKGADQKREELKRPYLESGRKIDARFKSFVEIVDRARKSVLLKLDAYRREVERKAHEERERAEREARAKEDAARKAAEEGKHLQAAKLEQQAEAAQARVQEAAPMPIRSAYGQTATKRSVWKHQVVDRKKLPKSVTEHPKVLEAIDQVVAGMVRGGAREIAGVRIYEESTTVVR